MHVAEGHHATWSTKTRGHHKVRVRDARSPVTETERLSGQVVIVTPAQERRGRQDSR